MNFLTKKRTRKSLLITAIITMALALSVAVCGVYVNDYYRADQTAIQSFANTYTVSKQTLDDNTIVYSPEKSTAGFIFYPGGKVEHTAYEPLMLACAQKGILCILVEMPFRLAVLDVNAADGYKEQYPSVEKWYVGGHSLGGSMAASYAAKHTDTLDGVILLGAYSTADLSETELDVLSVYGSNDEVMNREKYDKYLTNLPENFTEYVIDGGCHAYFGMYGAQDGDGTPTISNRQQILLTADQINALVRKN